ncbi:MAG TPA: class IV adenylate cyclase [Acidobacteriaceae bacterium]|nr:class IV adenylate cyclase [Acidobacteriaceae bacterium]
MSIESRTGQLEVEVKIRLTDRPAFAAKLPELGFRLVTPATLERNTLLDTKDSSLRGRREILRIRRYGDKWKLTHKADATGSTNSQHKVRVETETDIGDGQALTAVLERLGYGPMFVYEKLREEWTDGSGTVVLDSTPIGDFAELEGEDSWIDKTAAVLGVAADQYITASYARLFSDWKNTTKSPANNMTFEEVRATT